MDTNKILSADLLDLIFDNRNKDYGAYELRKTYHTRITKSLVFTGVFVSLVFTGVVLANKMKPHRETKYRITEGVTIASLPLEEKKHDPIPEPPPKKDPPQVQTESFTQIEIVKDIEVITSPPTQNDLSNSKIDVIKKDGIEYDGITTPQNIGEGKGIIEEPIKKEEGPLEFVEVEARFDGNWEKFWLRNLNPQTPIDNDAPTGNYTVWIQFVVDTDGSISDIKALTNIGFGLEQEAIRVIQKAKNWEPAIQNGRQVKAYRKQAITFQVTDEG